MTDNNETKNIENLVDNTFQERFKNDISNGISILNFIQRSGGLLPPWWSRQRDVELEKLFMNSDHMKGAVYKTITKLVTITPQVLPRNPSIKSHIVQANFFNTTLNESSEMGMGWPSLFSKWNYDMFVRDNGAFMEVLGKGNPDGPIQGPALGLLSLDSLRCQRTSNPEFPVIYTDTDGRRFKIHHTRVVFSSQLPNPQATLNNVGVCWLSRCADVVQNMIDIAVYKQEKLGSRPLRQMVIGKGISAPQIWEALYAANESMDNSGFTRYSGNVVIGSQSTDIDIELKDLASVPDGFDERTSIELGMFAIALAGGIPPRDLWPATTTGATRADAMFQHLVGGSGYRAILDEITILLGGTPDGPMHQVGKFLPPHLKLVFDFLDDDQDEKQSSIKKVRAETRNLDLETQVIDIRTARQLALEARDITQEQFNRLELKDGRLPTGITVLSLFGTEELLDFGFDILNVQQNIAERAMIIQQIEERIMQLNIDLMNNAPRVSQQTTLKQAVAALEKLKRMYEELKEVDEIPVEPTEEIEDDIEQDQEQKQRNDAVIIALSPKGAQQANYRRTNAFDMSVNRRCTNCRFNGGNNLCTLFNFKFTTGFVCDRWEPINKEVSPISKLWDDIPMVAEQRYKIFKEIHKQVEGTDIPDEVIDYEIFIADLIDQANDGEITQEEFEEQLEEETVALLTLLFLLGAGVDDGADLTDEQREALGEEIETDLEFIPNLSQSVFDGNFVPEDEGGGGNNILARVTLWAVFAASVLELGKMWNQDDPFFEWVITPGKDSCTDCIRLNGQVHTADEWLVSGWRPKTRRLACNGFNCGCSLVGASGPSVGGF